MGVLDGVLRNNDLFGEHKGETHCTQISHPVFPGSTYEITPVGRLELLECTYEDRSDSNAMGILRLAGMVTPVFTGRRIDVALHGWLEFPVSAVPSSPMVRWLRLNSIQTKALPRLLLEGRHDIPPVLSLKLRRPKPANSSCATKTHNALAAATDRRSQCA